MWVFKKKLAQSLGSYEHWHNKKSKLTQEENNIDIGRIISGVCWDLVLKRIIEFGIEEQTLKQSLDPGEAQRSIKNPYSKSRHGKQNKLTMAEKLQKRG